MIPSILVAHVSSLRLGKPVTTGVGPQLSGRAPAQLVRDPEFLTGTLALMAEPSLQPCERLSLIPNTKHFFPAPRTTNRNKKHQLLVWRYSYVTVISYLRK